MKIHKEKEGKRLKSFKEKRFTEAFKKEVVDHAKVHSARSAGLVFGLCESTVRSILKAASFPCNLCDRKCAYKRQLGRHLLEVYKVEQAITTEESPKKKVVSDSDEDEDGNPTNTQSTRSLPASFRFDLGW